MTLLTNSVFIEVGSTDLQSVFFTLTSDCLANEGKETFTLRLDAAFGFAEELIDEANVTIVDTDSKLIMKGFAFE